MPKLVSYSLKFYPAYCFPASPTFNAWVKLTAKDVHGLNKKEGFEGQNIYFYLNHPIKWVRLVGVIVSYEEFPNRWIFIIDDSSGATIEVTCPRNPIPIKGGPPTTASTAVGENGPSRDSYRGTTVTGNTIDISGIDLGSIVKVKGGIGEFRAEKQITLERINVMTDTTDEAKAWAELSQFRKSILSTPWTISAPEEMRLKEEADGTAGKAEKRRRKKHRDLREEKKERRAMKEKAGKAGKRNKEKTSDKENEAHQNVN